MNRTYLWKILLVVFVVAWALFAIYPPTGSSVIEMFKRRAVEADETFNAIVTKAEQLQAEAPEREFLNLLEAVGTNEVSHYFPFINASAERNPSYYTLTQLQKLCAGRIRLGLDLQGGTSFLVKMDTNRLERAEAKEAALSQAVEVLRRRVDKLGVSEPVIQPSGVDTIIIQMPGLSAEDLAKTRTNIMKAAFLEFRMVHPKSEEQVAKGIVPPGYEILTQEETLPNGNKTLLRYLVSKQPESGLTGKYIKRAFMSRNPISNQPEIHFELDADGTLLFGQVTKKYQPYQESGTTLHHRLAIVLDGELYSAPQINEPIEGGRGQITGSFTAREAFELANVLENPLEAPLKIIEERTVDPSLGIDSIRSGIKAAVVGIVAVAAFMLVYYLFCGLVANVALILNLIILLGVLCLLPATLTLPGIAGVVLTIGMAVDANVLIFERLREELKAGKSLRGAVEHGYGKAFSTILDANVTTLITAGILAKMGTGPVQGFGVTLFWGIIISMFTALFVTRLIFDLLVNTSKIKSIKLLQVFGNTKFDFLKWALPAFIASWVLIFAGNGYGIFGRGASMLGHEFAGGDSLRIEFQQKVGVSQLRDSLSALNLGSQAIQYQRDLSTGEENLLITTGFETGEQVMQGLQSAYPDAGFKLTAIDKVGPVVGKEILRSAVIAILLALFAILVYVALRFEFSFAVGAIIAILHDVLMTMAIFCFSGRELSAPMVAAILTIVGFSINDTIVIFDRIREDLKLGVRGSFKDVMNVAINQTLSRTIITSGTTLLSALALFIFGGGVINDFAFTFIVGIITGTYSSIYIASAFVLWWHKGEIPRASTNVVIDQAAAANASAAQ